MSWRGWKKKLEFYHQFINNKMGDIKKWDNNIHKFDVTSASRQVNPFLANYGYDRFSYTPEMSHTSALALHVTEGPHAHGYPVTAWIQLGLVYACGLYTAKE